MSKTDTKKDHTLKMADVSEKEITLRQARARGRILLAQSTIKSIFEGELEKGNVLVAARLAGINAAKKTSELIPLCHQLALNSANVEFEIEKNEIVIVSTVVCHGRTGVEMEALTAVATAALTIYDMCKPIDKDMRITDIVLTEKSGGRSGNFKRKEI